LSEWVLAEQIFQQVVQRTGGLGLFVVQAQSLLELSILFRYHGYYENALAILSQIEALMTRIPNHTLIEDLKLECAQIAIEKGDGSVALQYLNDIELGTKRLVLMKSEAYMLVGDHRRSIMYANQTVEASHQQGQVEARAYSIIGRSYVGQGDWQAALPYLGFALTILEQGDDPFALARAQANLGALLIQFGDYEEARQLLRLAERIQTRLADQPALAATQHNLRLLEIAASKVSS
jgi:tetratricopeptide (TPR) repeat protein